VILRLTLPFQLMKQHHEAVGPMKSLQGPTQVAGEMAPIPVKSSPIDLDTEGRVGEALGRPPI
jgi:hypothetical protein